MSALSTRDVEPYRHCRRFSLSNPPALIFPAEGEDIEVLALDHFVGIQSLEPIAALKRLRVLYLQSTPGWDGTSKYLSVETFEPLAQLPQLEVLSILAVVPQRDRLAPLERMSSLLKISIGNSNFYQLEDFAALSVALPNARASVQPIYQMNFRAPCRRCQQHAMLSLEGALPRTPRYACPQCNRKKLAAHLDRWNAAGGLPRYDAPSRMTAEDFVARFGNPGLAQDEA